MCVGVVIDFHLLLQYSLHSANLPQPKPAIGGGLLAVSLSPPPVSADDNENQLTHSSADCWTPADIFLSSTGPCNCGGWSSLEQSADCENKRASNEKERGEETRADFVWWQTHHTTSQRSISFDFVLSGRRVGGWEGLVCVQTKALQVLQELSPISLAWSW